LNGYKVSDTDYFHSSLVVSDLTLQINQKNLINCLIAIIKFEDIKKTKLQKNTVEYEEVVRFRNSCWLYLNLLPKRLRKYIVKDAIKVIQNRIKSVIENLSPNPLIDALYNSNFESDYHRFLEQHYGKNLLSLF
jgi:hypothetical protein